MSDEEVILRNFRGERFVYRQAREEVRVGADDPEYLFQPNYQLKKRRKKAVAKTARKTA